MGNVNGSKVLSTVERDRPVMIWGDRGKRTKNKNFDNSVLPKIIAIESGKES